MKTIKSLTIRRKPHGGPSDGLIGFDGRIFHCLLGKNGISVRKKEGDWKSPAGTYRLCFGFRRTDRMHRIATALPISPIGKNDGWCDAPEDRNYNRPVKLPYPTSAEALKREDTLYDFVIVVDHNFTRRIRERGSAIFFHLTADKLHTAGCIAIAPGLMRHILPRLSTRTVMRILP